MTELLCRFWPEQIKALPSFLHQLEIRMKSIKLAIPFALLLSVLSGEVLAGNTKMTITATNNTTSTVTPSGASYAGTVFPNPAPLNAGLSQTYINTGLGNVTSFHIDYSNTAGKKCHFDAASYNQTTSTSPCVYTKAAKSTGSTFATCTATVTSASTDPANCAFSVNFKIQ
jgi:hypothetical protein